MLYISVFNITLICFVAVILLLSFFGIKEIIELAANNEFERRKTLKVDNSNKNTKSTDISITEKHSHEIELLIQKNKVLEKKHVHLQKLVLHNRPSSKLYENLGRESIYRDTLAFLKQPNPTIPGFRSNLPDIESQKIFQTHTSTPDIKKEDYVR